jgi:hypothetical protein
MSPQPDHIDNVARMTVIQVNKPGPDDIAADKLNAYEKSKGTEFLVILYFSVILCVDIYSGFSHHNLCIIWRYLYSCYIIHKIKFHQENLSLHTTQG